MQQRSTLRQRLIAILVTSVGAAAAATVSFAITIYEAAHPQAVPLVPAGEAIDTGRWSITFHSASSGPVPPTGIAPWEPKNFVFVEFNLNNRSAATSFASPALFTVEPPVPDLPEPVFYLARDKSIASGLNPGMPERMIAGWAWPPERPLPATLRLAVASQIYKRRDNLYGASGWFDREPVATVELSVSQDAAGAAE
ncbi:MAG: hypothetical protein WBA88_02835 [Pseudaminobacter sp.]